ncbi:23S rRNA pseudouridine(1911/1915/1917) synthase RluD [Nitrosomonas sp.]|uniref:23S rRNA pseudouridine(1911/1915/1917) synthase RluD n=1 Tax=Nitrosomonas sp. TaxID=42353 RepID=UPI001DACA3F7|nr:23S rRNA pseudouridine(1911/1915/1917) synthase RluD [Nitrosomonas sp.]MBX3616512.1 23S rRNA pseudouridine(1911/1915/1917) synthase RluD [Nitrosomonas sp.]
MTSSINSDDQSGDYSVKPGSLTPSDPDCAVLALIIPIGCAGLRLDQALAKLLPHWSRSRLQTWIAENRVTLDDQPTTAKHKVWGNECVRVLPHDITHETAFRPENIDLTVIYEDDALIVIDKPAGLVTHPGNGNWNGTLLNALLHHAPQLEHVPRAGIVHRLDKNTTGLLVIAKTVEAQTSLVRQLQQRTVKRDYLALALGEIQQGGLVDAPIGRHPTQRTKMAVTATGKPARTHYQVIETFFQCTLLQCSLETGRTHQIRVHMNTIGHALIGDPVYGGKPISPESKTGQLISSFPRQALHARKLSLIHPKTGQVCNWEAPAPEDIDVLLQTLRQLKKN